MMHVSNAGLAFISQEEGTVLHTYLDSVGIPTIGVGHVLGKNESYPKGITREQALTLLSWDIRTAENAVNSRVTVDLNQNQFDALCSFVFNCGGGAFAGSTLLNLLNQGDYRGAADQFLVWRLAGGKPCAGIEARRKRERALFLTVPEQIKLLTVPDTLKDDDASGT